MYLRKAQVVINCVVLGQGWVAQAVAEAFGTRSIQIERAMYADVEAQPVVIHADACPNLDNPLQAWAWIVRVLAIRRSLCGLHWIQHSPAEVLAGAHYLRPYSAYDAVRPYDLKGQVAASLEWGLLSLGCPLTIVRSSLLYNGSPGGLLNWGASILEAGFGRVTRDTFSPTPVTVFAKAIRGLAEKRKLGIVHAACYGATSYTGVVQFLAGRYGYSEPVLELDTGPPVNLSLTSTLRLASWQEAMKEYLDDLTSA